MMNIDHILLNKYNSIIEYVEKSGAERAIIAGGAIRDMVLNKPINDIDVFFVGELDVEKLKQFFNITEDTKDQPDFYPKSDWKLSYNNVKLPDLPYNIQLIEVKKDKRKTYPASNTLMNHVLTFGCDLSMMIYSPLFGFIIYPEALQDMFLEKLTFNSKLQNPEYMYKIKNKYPDYMVDNQSAFEYDPSYTKTPKGFFQDAIHLQAGQAAVLDDV